MLKLCTLHIIGLELVFLASSVAADDRLRIKGMRSSLYDHDEHRRQLKSSKKGGGSKAAEKIQKLLDDGECLCADGSAITQGDCFDAKGVYVRPTTNIFADSYCCPIASVPDIIDDANYYEECDGPYDTSYAFGDCDAIVTTDPGLYIIFRADSGQQRLCCSEMEDFSA